VATGAGACVAAGVGAGAGSLPPPVLGAVALEVSGAAVVAFDFFFAGFFLGADLRAGSAAAPAMLTVMGAETSFTAVVPAAAFAVLAESLEPPVALPMPKATANATTTAASVIPI
jgi:hypothetical protein